MRLRPYQSGLVAEIGTAFARHRSVLLQLPTGGGKTHIAAHVSREAAARGQRVWIVSHRREIVGQTSASLLGLGVAHGVVGPGHPFEPAQALQVCSIASLSRRLNALPAPDLIVFDEAHHVASSSWSALRERFPQARHLGLTATPVRLDGIGLGRFFDVLLTGPSTATLMRDGHLSRYRLFAPTIPDLRGITSRAGDYAKDDLAQRMTGAALVGDVVEHYRRHAPDARAVAFAVTVEASRTVVARFNAAGIPARHIDGSTPATERDASIRALEAGTIRVLSNVEVFTEGFDLPAIDAVILLRPTRSFALYRQMVGRGLRTAPGKGPTVILDHAGLVYEHDLPDDEVEWSLEGVRRRPGAQGIERLRRCPECSAIHPQGPTCPECGHAYTGADRSIREVYGELRQIGRLEGYETLTAFARRVGHDHGSVRRFVSEGMPFTADHLVPISDALDWYGSRGLRDRRRPPLGGAEGEYETQIAFAARVGMTPGGVHKMTKRGLPVARNGWVHVEPALVWLATDRAARTKMVEPERTSLAGDTIAGFARRVGVGTATVATAKRRGLPLEPDGSIAVAAALGWWIDNPPSTKGRSGPDGHESVKAFCRRVGVSASGGARGLKRRGLPIAENGFVHIETALAWFAALDAACRVRDPRQRPPGGV